MAGCCDPRGCDEFFSERVAKRDAERYQRRGLDENAQRLVDLALRDGVDGMTVLEVGGGVGAIQLELLKGGAARTTNVELSTAYEPYAEQIADEAGFNGRSDRRILDFAIDGTTIDEADVVVLHKVICCYPDLERLLGEAAAHTRARLFLTFPRRAFWTRAGIGGANLIQRIRGKTFRAYVHSPAAITSIAEARGLQPVARHQGFVWELQGFVRARPSDGAHVANRPIHRHGRRVHSHENNGEPRDFPFQPSERKAQRRSPRNLWRGFLSWATRRTIRLRAEPSQSPCTCARSALLPTARRL